MRQFKISEDSDQKFSTIVNNRRITLRLWYANFNDRWSVDVSIDGKPVLTGRKIVTGVDLLEPFNFGIGAIVAHSESDAEPGRNQLPQGIVKLYQVSQEEIDAAISA